MRSSISQRPAASGAICRSTLPGGERSITISDCGSAMGFGWRFTLIVANKCAWRRDEIATPSAGIIDSQSVRSTESSDERGYDAGKKINGRKRHILVDTIGLLLLVTVLPANLQDRDGARQLLASFFSQCQSMRRRVRHIWADGGYAGTLVEWTLKLWRCTLEIVKRNELHTFKVL